MRLILRIAAILSFLSVALGWIALPVIAVLGLASVREIVECAVVLAFITVSDVITYRMNRRSR